MSMPQFKPYPAYKDSGVEWLGEIPAHWEAKKVRRLCLVRRGASPRPIDDQIYFDGEGEYAWVRIADVTASERYLEYTTQRLSVLGKSKSVPLEPGELFVSIAATVGKPVITKIKCCIHDGFVYFVGLRENREYLYYIFSCGEPYKGLGKLGTQLNLNTDTIGDMYLPLPPGAEQQVIVQFLDRETARIDALVAKKERLIELLQEKRTALITRAVTKGLDPNVPMKDSGVEWLGEIPAHWKVCALRHVIAGGTRNGLYKGPAYYQPDGTPMVQMGEAFASPVVASCASDRLKLTAGERLIWGLNEGDLLFARRSIVFEGSGKCSIVGGLPEHHVFESSLIRVRPDKKQIVPHFLFLFLQSTVSRAHILATTKQVTISGIDSQQLKALFVLVPPIEEQESIIKFIRAKDVEFHSLIAKIHEAIDRLRELRTALISAAVTGKIDVREEVA